MKASRSLLVGFSLGAALFVGGWLIYAQEDDTEAMLSAIYETTPIPASELPEFGNFYSAQHYADWPLLPGNVLGLSAWPLGDGFFLLDDRAVDYGELQTEATTLQSLESEEEESEGGGMMLFS